MPDNNTAKTDPESRLGRFFVLSCEHQGDWTSLYDEGDKVTMPNNAFTVGIIF